MGRRGEIRFHPKMRSGLKDNNPTAGGSSSAPPPPPWIDLPRDLTANILRRLGQVEILMTARKVCTTWRSLCGEPSFWRVIDLEYCSYEVVLRLRSQNLSAHQYKKFEISTSLKLSGLGDVERESARRFNEHLERNRFHNHLCRRAVDLSQGELIDINIDYFGTDATLYYISERSSHLKRLRLKCCNQIGGEALTTSIKKFPDLEELHLEFMAFIFLKDIEAISISCPKLKSLTFFVTMIKPSHLDFGSSIVEIDDSYALRIAKNMPNLRYLCLPGFRLSNEGRKAFLDNCPNLDFPPL
ncbi:hypothetical protein CASFOL_014531 [Castilleja foliolosa]|uniref:F-box domain-containing protein n=1 Tax=Castilleja foliolosa TaxID=1961234 RepID=A0ABD3DN53_9LAMI